MFKKKIKRHNKGCKPDFGKVANVRHLTRIISYLSEVECDYQTSIQIKTGVSSNFIKSAIRFLLNYKIVFITRRDKAGKISQARYYALNPLWKRK